MQDRQVTRMDVVQADELSHHLTQLHVPTSSKAVQGSELMKSDTASAAALIVGGDLFIQIYEVGLISRKFVYRLA